MRDFVVGQVKVFIFDILNCKQIDDKGLKWSTMPPPFKGQFLIRGRCFQNLRKRLILG